MACDASRRVKIAAKCPISSHRVAGPLSQQIMCDFGASQHRWNTPSQVCSIVACDPGLSLVLNNVNPGVV